MHKSEKKNKQNGINENIHNKVKMVVCILEKIVAFSKIVISNIISTKLSRNNYKYIDIHTGKKVR